MRRIAFGTQETQATGGKARRIWLLLCAFTVALLLFPVRNETIRLLLIAGIVGVWVGALFMFWRRLPVRLFLLSLILFPAALVFLPGRDTDVDSLCRAYVGALKTFPGTPYIWGGETRTGIDCSGLARQALVQAEIGEGIRTANPALIRNALTLWWDDCSARALGEEFHQRTIVQGRLSRLNEVNYREIRGGDLAVIGDGIHVLAYSGGKQWIQADPQAGSVITTPVPSNDIRLNLDATIVRWRILTPEAP